MKNTKRNTNTPTQEPLDTSLSRETRPSEYFDVSLFSMRASMVLDTVKDMQDKSDAMKVSEVVKYLKEFSATIINTKKLMDETGEEDQEALQLLNDSAKVCNMAMEYVLANVKKSD